MSHDLQLDTDAVLYSQSVMLLFLQQVANRSITEIYGIMNAPPDGECAMCRDLHQMYGPMSQLSESVYTLSTPTWPPFMSSLVLAFCASALVLHSS